MAKGKRKGSKFERDMARRLSWWWTEKTSYDAIWRSAGSGNMATVGARNRQQVKQGGDLIAIDASAQPLFEVFTIELKRGYNGNTIHDLLDKKPTHRQQMLDVWIQSAFEHSQDAGTPYWLLIHARDLRRPMVWFPATVLAQFNVDFETCCVVQFVSKKVYSVDGTSNRTNIIRVVGVHLDEFLKTIQPDNVRYVWECINDD
jgi:hypothetical protein